MSNSPHSFRKCFNVIRTMSILIAHPPTAAACEKLNISNSLLNFILQNSDYRRIDCFSENQVAVSKHEAGTQSNSISITNCLLALVVFTVSWIMHVLSSAHQQRRMIVTLIFEHRAIVAPGERFGWCDSAIYIHPNSIRYATISG